VKIRAKNQSKLEHNIDGDNEQVKPCHTRPDSQQGSMIIEFEKCHLGPAIVSSFQSQLSPWVWE
jgi:hypothetical protein